MAEQQTYVEQQEAIQSALGNAVPAGEVDKSMLEIWETNQLWASDRQVQLAQAWRLLHDALVKRDNLKPVYEDVLDKRTGEIRRVRVVTDNWSWMLDFDYGIRTKQLTRGGYSRQQHLGVATATVLSMQAQQQQNKGFWGRLFG
jgi:hypothetical protein